MGTRIPMVLHYPEVYQPPKKGKKETTKKAAQKSITTKATNEIPDAVPAINPVSPLLVTNALGPDVDTNDEEEAVGETVDVAVVPDPSLLIECGGIAAPSTIGIRSLIDDVEELVEGKIISPKKQLLDTRSDKGMKSDAVCDLERRDVVGLQGLGEPSDIEEPASPKQVPKRKFFELKEDQAGVACQSGVNHEWHEFINGAYVVSGFLSGGKRCIGKRNGQECCRLFVPKAIAVKVNESETEFYPTLKRPAYGCTICRNGMCFECKNHYEQRVRQSPGKKGRIARSGNKVK
jgi:hypothetical protein